jgi:hypothetical protein
MKIKSIIFQTEVPAKNVPINIGKNVFNQLLYLPSVVARK